MPTLVVQMGHTGRPPHSGSVGTAGEQDFSRAVGAACQRLLNRNGWAVRTIIADPTVGEYRGDAFVAIHADGSTNPDVRGGSVGYQTPEGGEFAHAWQAAYVRLGWAGGWQRDNYTTNLAQYYGVRAAVGAGNRKAFIAECGHLTSPMDRELMLGPGGYDRVALAIGAALGIITIEENPMPFDASQINELNLRSYSWRDTNSRNHIDWQTWYYSEWSNMRATQTAQSTALAQLLALHGGGGEAADSITEAIAAVGDKAAAAAHEGAKAAVTEGLAAQLEQLQELLESDNADQAHAVVVELRNALPSA